jgi:hypothetical protein
LNKLGGNLYEIIQERQKSGENGLAEEFLITIVSDIVNGLIHMQL